MKKVLLMLTAAVIFAIFYSLLTSENINSLEGEFQELAFKRNENNTGPVRRVYAFALSDTLWVEIEKHADLLPHTKYGSTEVYYFLQEEVNDANLELGITGINREAQMYCIGYAKIDGQSRLRFTKYPYK